jgi:zinc protease
MRFNQLAAALALAGLGSCFMVSAATPAGKPAAAAAQGAVVSDNGQLAIRHEKYKLANGLEIILVEDHRLPLVAFNLWIHAGPRNEARGQTGFAHLFEHLMFAGTKHSPRGETDKLIDSVGGTDSNGSTNFDRTNYFFTLPSNQLELGLWIKSDMLGFMTDEVDSTALANQQDVVRNERRQRTENRPYGMTDEAIYQALFPEGHPYRAVVIGSHADIQSIKLEDVKAFARTYYRPNNATLVLAGDFQPAQAKALVQKYFGALKAGEPVAPVVMAQPALSGEKRLQLTDRVELPRLDMAWHTPAIFKPGDAELDVASAILGEGKASRLYKTLVYDKQLAQSVAVNQSSLSLGSVFSLEVLARPGKSLADIEPLVDAELANLAKNPPTQEEVNRAVAAIQTRLLQRLEKVTTLADTLNSYNQQAGDPDFVGKDLARYRAVTPQAVSAVVAAQLRKDARVVASTLPGAQQLGPEVPTPAMPTTVVKGEALNADEPWRAVRPGAGKAKPLALPAGKRFALANGLTVVHVPKPGLPLVSATLVLCAGQSANPLEQPGLSGFTAAMLQEGTASRSAQQIADQVADLGATLNSGSRLEDARIELSSMKPNFAKGLELLADVALHPAFAPAEVERIRAARLGALAQQRAQAPALASVIANQALFGPQHPLGASALGTEASLKAMDAAALKAFWQANYRPDQAALVVAGDIGEAELRQLAQQLFGAWPRPAAKPATQAATPQPTPARLVLVDKPGAPQTALSVVQLAPRGTDPHAQDIDVMNAGMGGLFTSRINHELREVKGYTYGIYSGYALGRETGIASVRGSVRTDVTGPALADMFKQIDGVRAEPMGADEFSRVRNAELLALPGLFDTNRAIVAGYASDWSAGKPADSIVKLAARLSAVTAKSAFEAAKAHADPGQFIVVAVGDKVKILPQLQAFGRKPLELRDTSGMVLPSDAKP